MEYSPRQLAIQQALKRWLSEVVIANNFCPFAKNEFDAGAIRYAFAASVKTKPLLEQLKAECELLVDKPAITTSLLIVEAGLDDFARYLDVLYELEDFVEEHYFGVFQLASFHPHYQFAGSDYDDAANYTNRAPWPMFHLLRESSISAAVDAHKNIDAIGERNMRVAEELEQRHGPQYWPQLLRTIKES